MTMNVHKSRQERPSGQSFRCPPQRLFNPIDPPIRADTNLHAGLKPPADQCEISFDYLCRIHPLTFRRFRRFHRLDSNPPLFSNLRDLENLRRCSIVSYGPHIRRTIFSSSTPPSRHREMSIDSFALWASSMFP